MKAENLKANQQQDKQNQSRALRAPRDSGDANANQTPMSQASGAAKRLAQFIGSAEMESILCACRGEESAFFKSKLVELAGIVDSMPTTYETDGMGDQATAWLHYFTPAGDFYVTERDQEEEQLQAFGLACIYEDELGYISICELIECGAELDLYWTPKSLGQVKAEWLLSDANYVGHPMHY